jgi:hypothetical protein
MYRKVACLVAALAALSLAQGPASAGGRDHHHDRKVLAATSTVVGAGATAAYFAINDWNWKWDSARSGLTSAGAIVATTIGCAAVSPMVATAVLNRPLSYREAHVLVASCIIPFVGGWLVNEAYDHHIMWAPDEPAAAPTRQWKRHAKR